MRVIFDYLIVALVQILSNSFGQSSGQGCSGLSPTLRLDMLSRMTFLASSVVLAILALTIRPGLEDITLAVLLGKEECEKNEQEMEEEEEIRYAEARNIFDWGSKTVNFCQEESYRS